MDTSKQIMTLYKDLTRKSLTGAGRCEGCEVVPVVPVGSLAGLGSC